MNVIAPDRPKRGEQATFEIHAKNNLNYGVSQPHSDWQANDQLDVKVKIELSPGLVFREAGKKPGTDLHRRSLQTLVWDVGHLTDGVTSIDGSYIDTTQDVLKNLSVTVDVTMSSLPLEERCLTATVIDAVPDFALDPKKRENDIDIACLPAEREPRELISEGPIILWWPHDCVGYDDLPCDSENNLKLLIVQPESTIRYLKSLNVLDHISKVNLLETDALIIHVKDPSGRQYDAHTHSVTTGSKVSWQTARRESGVLNLGGVWTLYSRQGYNRNISEWSGFVRTATVSGHDSNSAPGKVNIRFDGGSGNTYINPSESGRRSRFDLARWGPRYTSNDFFVEFENLGTYVVTLGEEATRTDGTPYNASATYTFHVGPISELAVWSGEASPLASQSEWSYTFMAANHGPDVPPAVEVALSGVPEGARALLAEHDGTYRVVEGSCKAQPGQQTRLCDAVWDLGEMALTPEDSRHYGRSEFPMLTLIAPGEVSAGAITATISNTQPYTVVIDGDTHSTDYFDYWADNDRVVVQPQHGTGEGDPGTPAGVRTIATSAGTLLQWDAVELLNHWPVHYYAVRRDGATLPGQVMGTLYLDEHTPASDMERVNYQVRSVNTWGVAGWWSDPLVATDPQKTITVAPTELTVAKRGAAASAGYTVVLDAPTDGTVTVAVASADPGKVTVDRSLLAFAEANWNVPQTVTATWVDASAVDPTPSVRIAHTARGGGYEGVPVDPVTVTARATVLEVNKPTLEIPENRGQDTYTIALNSVPASEVLVDISSGDSGVATVSPPRLVFTPANYAAPQTVTVSAVDDIFLNAGGRRVTQISHRISGGGLPAVTLAGPEVIVTDDDKVAQLLTVGGPSVEVRETDDPDKDGEQHKGEFTVRLAKRPESAVTVTMTPRDPYVTVVPATLTFTPSTWMTDQTVTVTAIDDDDHDDLNDRRETVIRLAAAGGGFDGATSEVEVVVIDDDATTGTVTVAGIPTEDGTGTRISEHNGVTRLTIDLGRYFTEDEGITPVIPLCLGGKARPGTHYNVALAGDPLGVALSGANTLRPLIEFNETGAKRVLVDFTGKVHGTSESTSRGSSTWAPGTIDFTVKVCDEVAPGDIREISDVSFTGDTSLHTVSILDGALMQEGERLTLPLYLRAEIAGELALDILQHHYAIQKQALPSEYDHPEVVTAPTLRSPGTFSLRAKQGGRSGDRHYDVVACEERPGELCLNNPVAAFAGGNDTITVTIIDRVPGAPQPESDSIGQSQDAESLSACVSQILLDTVRRYYDANRDKAPNYGENWKRVLITFGDIQDANLTPFTEAEARAEEEIWAGWLPTRLALECIEKG